MATRGRQTYRTPKGGSGLIEQPHTAAAQDADRNPGLPLDLSWVRDVRVNRSAVERRAQSHTRRRSIKGIWQAAWYLKATTLIDLTTLSGDDSPGRVRRLCAKARQPIRLDILRALGAEEMRPTVAAVCVYHRFVEDAVHALEGTPIPVAAVSTGFPAGLSPLSTRLDEIRASVAAGAREIDIVITRSLVLTGAWEALYDEVSAFREACGAAHLKTILGTGDLGTLRDVGRASLVCMMAGADFIKTSTGKEPVNATLPVGLVMARMIREYRDRTGVAVGLKPAGGIRQAKETLSWLSLMKDELGPQWLQPALFRFGASSLLTDLERQLEHAATGRYSADYRHPLA